MTDDHVDLAKAQLTRAQERKLPLPAGVRMVRLDKRVTGLRLDGSGLALKRDPDSDFAPTPRIVGAKSRMLKSRFRVRFADGSELTMRPYKPGEKDLKDVGQLDTLRGDAGTADSTEVLFLFLIIALAIVFFVPWIYMFVRELLGVNPRARIAREIVTELGAHATPD